MVETNRTAPRPGPSYWTPVLLALSGAAALWHWVPESLTRADSQSYLPHGFCYLWNPRLLTLHVASDLVIFLAYLAISCTLVWLLVRERRRIPFAWIFAAFGLFIIACAFTHAMDVVVLWKSFYWLQGDIKLLTAFASLITAIALPFYIPQVRALLDSAESSSSNERRFLAASDSSGDSFYILESLRNEAGEITDFRFSFVNANGARLLSTSPENLRGRLLLDLYPSHRANGRFDDFKQVAETGVPLEQEFAIDEPGINATWLRHQVVKLEDGIAVTTTDISARKRDEQKLESLVQFTQSVFASSPYATIVTDLAGTITSVNAAAERMLGYSRNDLLARATPLLLLAPEAIEQRAARLSLELGAVIAPGIETLAAKPRRGLVEEAEWRLIRKDGSSFEAQLTISALLGDAGQIAGLVLIGYDITERKRAEEYISHLAHHDALTGLSTRTLLHERLNLAIARATRTGRVVALLMVDVDRFKKVNDLLGHHIGDQLLVQIAQRLQARVRHSDTVSRMGGDEFVILLEDLHGVQDAEAIADQLLLDLQSPFPIGTQTLHVTASIGLCLYPENGETADALLQNADAAMYRVKSEGRNACQSFTPDMASASSRKRDLESGLQQALPLDELQLLWQPQICLATGRLTGLEALMRWHSGRLGLVMPGEFIPIAEESGLIVPMGEWALRTACLEGRRLQLELGRPLVIAVNVSPRQLHQEGFPRIVAEALRESGLAPASLELEITESILLNDSPRPLATLESVRALGVRLAIDDFGTGFSSMSYIQRFHADRIKIDQSFIRNMITEPDSRAITSAVIALSSGLNIQVVAEGVETAEHQQLLSEMGCNEAQGYLYSKPVPIEAVSEVMHHLEQRSTHASESYGGWSRRTEKNCAEQ